MHSAGLELTKLTYTRLEDNLIRGAATGNHASPRVLHFGPGKPPQNKAVYAYSATTFRYHLNQKQNRRDLTLRHETTSMREKMLATAKMKKQIITLLVAIHTTINSTGS